MASSTITVRGIKIRSRSNRRYVAIRIREHNVTVEGQVYVRFAQIDRRSDSLATAQAHAAKYRGGLGIGTVYVVVDTVTGEEV